MPANASSTRWMIAAGVLIAATLATIATPYFAAEPLDRISVRTVAKPPAQAAMPAPPTAAVPSDGPIAWTLPEGWAVIPTKTMRLASFSVGDGAECGLFLFPGGGDRLANVNRWRGQVGLAPLDEAALAPELTAGTCGFGPFEWLPVRGASKAFFAAIVPTPSGQCFVKLEATGEHLDDLRDAFLAFTTSLRPAGGAP